MIPRDGRQPFSAPILLISNGAQNFAFIMWQFTHSQTSPKDHTKLHCNAFQASQWDCHLSSSFIFGVVIGSTAHDRAALGSVPSSWMGQIPRGAKMGSSSVQATSPQSSSPVSMNGSSTKPRLCHAKLRNMSWLRISTRVLKTVWMQSHKV